ncbi:MAG: hypothetical protein K0S16_1222, partial [Moraxellaceae bacterium]|nr:hypothetical protein [Moraxellaceae bacterium]
MTPHDSSRSGRAAGPRPAAATPPVPYTGRLLARLGALAGLVATAALPAAPA